MYKIMATVRKQQDRFIPEGVPQFLAENYPAYEQTTLAQRKDIWKQYCRLRALENSNEIMIDQARYSFVQEQLNLMHSSYISRFSSLALIEEDCFI